MARQHRYCNHGLRQCRERELSDLARCADQSPLGVVDPAAVEGSDEDKRAAFARTYEQMQARIAALLKLDFSVRDERFSAALREIGKWTMPMSEHHKKLFAEFLGTAFLLATVVGSGIMAERLAGGNVAIALLGNTIPTGAILFVLITMFGPISGAHFNPAVSFAMVLNGELNEPMHCNILRRR